MIRNTLRTNWDDDQRMEGVSVQGKFLWITGAKYACHYGTGEFVPEWLVLKCLDGASPYLYATELCQAGLWLKARGGYCMVERHDSDGHEAQSELRQPNRKSA